MHPPSIATLPRPPRPEVRDAVRDLLMKSPAFAALPPARQLQVAKDTTLIANYLAAPEDIEGNRLAGGLGMPATALATPGSYDANNEKVEAIGDSDFKAGAIHEGVAAAKEYIDGVNFPAFVGGLISNVFQAIVSTSMEQMEAYGKLVASVSMSLGQFMQDNVSENQGRDHIQEKFPDMFEMGTDDMDDNPQPRLKLRGDIDEGAALARVNSSISFENGALKSLDLSDANVERALVVGARMQLAKQRQQMMASMILLGINRIVVTDGKISAKVLFDFTATSGRDLSRSAEAFDMARDQAGNVQTTRQGVSTRDRGSQTKIEGGTLNAESFSRGTYKYQDRPIITAKSSASETSSDMIKAKASLTGAVEVNFKSDYLPLDKMATPGMISAIQGNATPVDPNVLPSARVATPPPIAAAPVAARV
ncbi:hypothetical protein VH567_00065 [Sphingomonas sp. 4RDLI-65]|uniref:hypothetical protein n=1 Tax=Sphingomonas sp. 4RDLI-65 TaxID=3111641 RepID=UPI003C26CC1E